MLGRDRLVLNADGPLGERCRKLLAHQTVGEVIRFGIVGVGATLTHAGVYSLLVTVGDVAPLASNFCAFGVALLVSFAGHFFWTFGDSQSGECFKLCSPKFVKFVLTQASGLGLNTLFVWLCTGPLALPELYAVGPMVFITPPVTFLINKYWVFEPKAAA